MKEDFNQDKLKALVEDDLNKLKGKVSNLRAIVSDTNNLTPSQLDAKISQIPNRIKDKIALKPITLKGVIIQHGLENKGGYGWRWACDCQNHKGVSIFLISRKDIDDTVLNLTGYLNDEIRFTHTVKANTITSEHLNNLSKVISTIKEIGNKPVYVSDQGLNVEGVGELVTETLDISFEL